MGEHADDILSGFTCQYCGQVVDGKEPGYSRICKDCENLEDNPLWKLAKREKRNE
jgi:hypothetical protein